MSSPRHLRKSGGRGIRATICLPRCPLLSWFQVCLDIATELLVIRHLYGRPLETLLATWGIGLVLIWAVRRKFGDNVSVAPPRWMEGGWEIAPDLVFPLNRLYIILFCAICIAIVYFVVNGTKLGLLLRATTQNREMASALGRAHPAGRWNDLRLRRGIGRTGRRRRAALQQDQPQRRPGIHRRLLHGGRRGRRRKWPAPSGRDWDLDSSASIWSRSSARFRRWPPASSVIGKVLVLGLIIIFLQRRPQGLFPPKGRNADA